MTKEIRGISVNEVEQSRSSSVWVLNVSGGRGSSKGIINISVTEGNGRQTIVRVPVTDIPIDLTTQATKRALVESPDFRRLAAAGAYVKLIREEDAATLLSTERAKEEYRRLLSLERSSDDGVQAGAPTEVQSMMMEDAGSIGGFAMNIAHSSDGNEDDVVTSLRINAENLTVTELQYIVNTSVFPKVKALAAELVVK